MADLVHLLPLKHEPGPELGGRRRQSHCRRRCCRRRCRCRQHEPRPHLLVGGRLLGCQRTPPDFAAASHPSLLSDTQPCRLHNLIALARALPIPETSSSLIIDSASMPASPPPPPCQFPPQHRQDIACALGGRVGGVDDLPRKQFGQGSVGPPARGHGRGGLCGLCGGAAPHGQLQVGGGGRGTEQ